MRLDARMPKRALSDQEVFQNRLNAGYTEAASTTGGTWVETGAYTEHRIMGGYFFFHPNGGVSTWCDWKQRDASSVKSLQLGKRTRFFRSAEGFERFCAKFGLKVGNKQTLGEVLSRIVTQGMVPVV